MWECRAAYYKWLNRKFLTNEIENERIAETIEQIHTDSPDKGYRRIRDDLERYCDIKGMITSTSHLQKKEYQINN